ncbi:MAG: hypothetical protein KDC98_25075 [Planctomycetes bacterium]|nr:hypothetical protein [Planctomycetota bacterium]
MTNPIRRSAAALAAAVLSLSAAAGAQDICAWAWVNPPTTGGTFTPAAAWRYSSSGSVITVTRDPLQANVFTVTVPNITTVTGGVVHATAHNGNHTAVVNSWVRSGSDIVARIALFRPNGAPANNANFSFSYRFEGPDDARQAHLWANQPAASSYTPLAPWNWNGNRAAATITRLGAGHYRVLLPGLASQGSEQGHVQVTAWGATLRRAAVFSWDDVGPDKEVIVVISDASGTSADGAFVLSYNEVAAPISPAIGSGAHVFAHNAYGTYGALYAPVSNWVDSNGRNGPHGEETVRRLGTGEYVVNLPDVVGTSSSNAQVTPWATAGHYASLRYWGNDGCGGADVHVDTFDHAGNPADTPFALLYLTNRPAARPEYAWAVCAPTLLDPNPTPAQQFSSAGGTITVTQNLNQLNQYRVLIPGMGRSTGGIAHVCANFGTNVNVLQSWSRVGDDVVVVVNQFDVAGNPSAFGDFNVCFHNGGLPGAREAYCWANQPTTASYNPHPSYAWNADRGAPVITRSSTGIYQVRFPNLAPTGSELGSVMVSPKSNGVLRAMMQGWFTSGNDVVVNVRCYNQAGSHVDGQFSCSYEERAARMAIEDGSGIHVYANNPTTAAYAPNPAYTDSNCNFGPTGFEWVTRNGTGSYTVQLPDAAPVADAVPMVTSAGLAVTHATLAGWTNASPSGIRVNVVTRNISGQLVDAPFTLFYMSPEPLVTPATNLDLGGGCNGPVLEGITRPVLCRDWHLRLRMLPAGSVLAFLQLGLSDPSTSLGGQAPGCRIHTSGDATLFLPVPVPVPAYSLTVPQSPSFLGLSIYAQGGAFVPGINALSLALSNGLRATFGDY